jgi:hypothetical protein
MGELRALTPLMRIADHPDESVRAIVKNAIRNIRRANRA